MHATIVLVDVGLEVVQNGRRRGNSGAARTDLQWLVRWLSLV